MDESTSTQAERIATAAREFHQRTTGQVPRAVTVVLGEETLVITLHAALSPAEQALSRTSDGAARVREFHRQLFASSFQPLRKEIEQITGCGVREAAAEIEPETGAVVQIFTTGDMVQVFQLTQQLPDRELIGTFSNPDGGEHTR